MIQFPRYPELDTEIAGYTAAIRYEGWPLLVIPGLHAEFDAAKHRALRVSKALLAAGETGVRGWVTVKGERPPGFPRNGVRA